MKIEKLYPNVAQLAENKIAALLPYQVLDKESDSYGGFYAEDIGFCTASNRDAALFVKLGCWAYCSKDSTYFNDPLLHERLLMAIRFIDTHRRPSGFVDLTERNYDSPPDTAFLIATVARGAWMARHLSGADRREELDIALAKLLKDCSFALADHGGFHTPNHRWMIVGSLSLAQELYPELNLRPTIDKYLAEGIDLNSAGLYSEKSFGYSAHINNHLLEFYYAFGEEWILDKIQRNCHGILDMMNADTTFLTNISIRQDNGKKMYPTSFLTCFLAIAHYKQDARILSAIASILQVSEVNDLELLYLFARHPEWKTEVFDVEPLTEDYEKNFTDVGIWKWKQGEMSVTAMTDQIGALSFQYGDIAIPEIRMRALYFTAQKYTASQLQPTENGMTMTLQPTYGAGQELLMPGYWEPLNRPVPFEDLPYNNLDQRTPSPRPNVAYQWTVEKKENGIDLTVESVGGMDKVYSEVEFVINLPGILISENGYDRLDTSRVYQFNHGYLTYRIGTRAVTIGPGHFGNNNIERVIPQDKNVLKLVVGFELPLKHTFQIRCFRLDGAAPEEYRKVLR